MDLPKFIVFKVLLMFFFHICYGSKVLVVFPLPSKSHSIVGNMVVKHLLNAGHEVTYITAFVIKEDHPQLRVVDVSENRKIFNENTINVKQIMDKRVDFGDVDFIATLTINISTNVFAHENVQKVIWDPNERFDIVIGQWMFNELYCLFAAIFGCPMIWISSLEPHWMILNLIDGPTNPAYSNAYQNAHIHPLSFVERVHELWFQIDGLFRKTYKYYYKEEETYQRLIVPILKQKGRVVPSYDELRYNISLVLGNTQAAIGEAIALPQSYKHIGGFHIDDKVQPLPENLKNIFDDAKYGVVYFSMGSNIKSKDLPEELKQGILKVFGDLKETVLWKLEETLSEFPKNVHIVQWAPQQSILAHPKLKLFISHGGMASLTETVHFGVPVIVVPVFSDQFANALRAEKKGYGIKVDLTYTMHEDLKVAIDEVLSNSKYAQKAIEISFAYRSHPTKSKDELVFWVNHVIETRGAGHLRSPAHQIPLYKRIFLDLIFIIFVFCFAVTFIFTWFFMILKRKIILHKKQKSS